MKIQERYLEYPKRHITPNDTRPYAESSYTCTDLTLNPRSSVFRPQTWLQTEALFGESRLLCDADLGPFTCHSTSFSVFTFTFTFQKLKSGDKDNLSGSGAGPSWYHARKIDSSPQKDPLTSLSAGVCAVLKRWLLTYVHVTQLTSKISRQKPFCTSVFSTE